MRTEGTTGSHFENLLEESAKVHGHLCPGQVLGVRMSLIGLQGIGIRDPKGKDRKNLIVFVEMDRCATDAIQSVTGCSLGHRTMKFVDYGKMAATFMNLKTGAAVRILAKEEAREKTRTYPFEIQDKYRAQIESYKEMPETELFSVMDVSVHMRDEDLPGRPLKRVQCEICGEYVQDRREIYQEEKVICRPCAYGGYYRASDAFFLDGVMRNSHNGMEIRSKCWLEIDREPVFGRGRRFLLESISKHGSINQAARDINISYKKAWSYIRAMEERLGMKLVERKAGGRQGGGATLTREAGDFLKRYELLEAGLNDLVDMRFRKIFGK